MTVTYRGTVYDVIRYSNITGKIIIRLHADPTAPIRTVLPSYVIMSDEVRNEFAIPRRRNYVDMLHQEQFKNDPIIDTEP